MQDITPGQRWISDTEVDLGLGTVLTVEHRTVTVAFLAAGETRIYAKQTAPLTRVRFAPGDTIHNQQDMSLHVDAVLEEDGLLIYQGKDESGNVLHWPESQLNNFIQLSRPSERLFAGQLDANKWFELRFQSLRHANRLAHSDLYGLVGVRTSLIPHQLFIAHEVAHRFAPRVLLADEVGLGKTIEAGLILHQQLLTERAKRILIIVPETLVHQWLVEMLRRFNLQFSVFDEERCLGLEEDEAGKNPFHSAQLVLCSLAFLTESETRFQQVLAGEWDLLVVDEAHHLQWSPQNSSTEYQLIEQLTAVTKGVLLLTATPEQLGKESHFARLRLLDPNRFPDFDAFIQEEAGYQPVAAAMNELLNEQQTLSKTTLATLHETLVENDNPDNVALLNTLTSNESSDEDKAKTKHQLIDMLLDRHGTGRVLFRNTRAAVKGFPERHLNSYPLPLPAAYKDAYDKFIEANAPIGPSSANALCCPERLISKSDDVWMSFDPRIQWLEETIKQLRPEKLLVIAANSSTALGIAHALKSRSGIHAPVFHEHLSIIERDRAAAHFADPENGGQLLICSEIGSEGRNFQFSHHLVLFDLPLNPDLLEQRIGRLDRIGQQNSIQIHVPYFTDSPQALLLNWYHLGLAAFEHTCPVGPSVFKKLEVEFYQALGTSLEDDQQSDLIDSAHQYSLALNDALHKGRDILLEYNSCIPSIANTLRDRAIKADQDSDIQDYLDKVFDCFGVDSEFHSPDCYIVKPGEHMHSHFPGLNEDGMKVTFRRELALSNEDMHFITWEHPLASGALDLVLSNETGNTALIATHQTGLRAGSIYLECVYLLETVAQTTLQSKRYLPPTAVRLVVDERGEDVGGRLTHESINKSQIPVDPETAGTVIRTQAHLIKRLVDASETLAAEHMPKLIASARRQSLDIIGSEIKRLRALQAHNANVREEEILFFEKQSSAIEEALASAGMHLDSVRIVIAT